MAAFKQRKPVSTDGEYVINNNETSNQDWILSAYRSLEPRVSVMLLSYISIMMLMSCVSIRWMLNETCDGITVTHLTHL